jgi:hypothetical protein
VKRANKNLAARELRPLREKLTPYTANGEVVRIARARGVAA